MNPTPSPMEAPPQAQTDSPCNIAAQQSVKRGRKTESGSVGAVLRNPIASLAPGATFRGVAITQADIDIELQILDCSAQSAQEERRGNAEAALSWSQAMQQAIAARRPEVVKAWEDEERERLDHGFDFFQSEYARAMGRPGVSLWTAAEGEGDGA